MIILVVSLLVVALFGTPYAAEAENVPACRPGCPITILTLAGLASAMTWNIDQDDDLSNVLMESPHEKIIGFGNDWGNGFVIGGGSVGVYAIGALGGGDRLRDLGADMARSYAVSGVFTLALKVAINRPRPSGGDYSYPSGHTASAFSIVPALHHHVGWKASLPAAGLGVITALGRMQDRHHYLSDVITGAALGWVVGDQVTRALRSRRDSGNVMLAPGVVGYSASF